MDFNNNDSNIGLRFFFVQFSLSLILLHFGLFFIKSIITINVFHCEMFYFTFFSCVLIGAVHSFKGEDYVHA